MVLFLDGTRTGLNYKEPRDYWSETPASDSEYEIFRRQYAYEPAPLNPVVEATDTFEHWIRERVSFDLPYGGERGAAYLYLPTDAVRPLQTVVYWPGAGYISLESIEDVYLPGFDFLVKSGRAVALPIFKGALDRDDSQNSIASTTLGGRTESLAYRDILIEWVKDLSRTIDYLETRADIDAEKLAYYGFSWGGAKAPVVLAVEPRIRVAALNVGGFGGVPYLPEVDALNFAPRVRVPVLMVNGEYDIVFPLETAQKPLFELLGTDPAHKKHYISPSAHIVPQDELIRETLDWLDRYLGVPAS